MGHSFQIRIANNEDLDVIVGYNIAMAKVMA